MKLPYRDDVDGLRAYAVLAVVLYHAEMSFGGHGLMAGGFIGVDIFFVISGYLITRIIVSELNISGRFGYWHFILRRARRLLPALLTVIIFTLPLGFWNFLPGSLIELCKSAISAIGFSSNFFFFFNTVEYGANSGLFKPYLHTWSLAVEEQFYLLAPGILVYLALFRRWTALVGLSAIMLCSFLLYASLAPNNPIFGFFLPVTRAWEILAGAVLAYFEMRVLNGNRLQIPQQLLAKFLTSAAALTILVSIFTFDTSDQQIWYLMLLPVASTVVLIAFSEKDHPVSKILRQPAILYIGLCSYSIYLWHYPLMAFARSNGLLQTNVEKLGVIAMSMLAASITYRYVETPFRSSRIISRGTFFTFMVPTTLATIILCGLTVQQNGWPHRVNSHLLTVESLEDLTDDKGPCHDRIEGFCYFETGEEYPTVVVVGDSHFLALSKSLKKLTDGKFNLILANLGGCPFALHVDRLDSRGNVDVCDAELQKRRLSLLADQSDILLTGGRLPLYLSGVYFDNGEGGKEGGSFEKEFTSRKGDDLGSRIVATLEEVLARGNQVVFLYPVPEVGFNVPQAISNKLNSLVSMNRLFELGSITTSSSVFQERTSQTFDLIDQINSPNFHRIYPHELFCDNSIPGRCVTHDEENVFYQDDDHPGGTGDDMINQLIFEKLEHISQDIIGNPLRAHGNLN